MQGKQPNTKKLKLLRMLRKHLCSVQSPFVIEVFAKMMITTQHRLNRRDLGKHKHKQNMREENDETKQN